MGTLVRRRNLGLSLRRSMVTKLSPIHPGEVLAEDFMVPRGLTANQLALDQRRYRPAPRPVFRDDTIAVAESPVELRPGMREGQFRREDRARSGGPVGLRAGYEPRSDRTVT